MYKLSLVSLPIWSFSSSFHMLLLQFVLFMSELHAASCTLLFKCSLYLDILTLQYQVKTLLEESFCIVSIFFCFKFTEKVSVSTGYLRKSFLVNLRNMLPKNNDGSAEKRL